jgi:3-hydroxyacyl-CoA dehydrogenase
MAEIKRVAVIGAGTMGAGIAAQIANAGVKVLLLDIVPAGANDMHDRNAALVETGNIDDDLGRVAECDWIVEAVLERTDVKQALYRRLDALRRPGTAISSNTSTIALKVLTEGMSEQFRRDFLITHFFNPPRYMRLIEIVAGPESDPATVAGIERFVDVTLGKSVVRCEDSPGFIANRLGIYWMQLGMIEAIDLGLTVEEADAVNGRPFGIPRTGVFGLMDLVGIDLGPHINASMRGVLPADDAFHAVDREVPLIGRMIAAGLTGRKGKGGFYRLDRTAAGRTKVAMDLASGEYRAEQVPVLPEVEAAGKDLHGLLAAPTKAGRYAFRVFAQVITYAATLVPEAAGTIADIDAAMRLGYAWKWGPFELADKIGTDWLIGRLTEAGLPVPALLASAAGRSFYRLQGGKRQFLGLDGAYHDVVRPEGVLLLEDIRLAAKPVLKTAFAAVWDIGDGVACLEFISRSNLIDAEMLDQAAALVRERFKALVTYNEGGNFSLGVDLAPVLAAARAGAWGEIEALLAAGQQALTALKYAPFPVVAAPAGMAVGGGCTVVLHADAVQAHAEANLGLVECGVGLVPSLGGCAEMLARWQADPAVFETVRAAEVSKSAQQAVDRRFLRPTDGITMNRDRLLADAKARALALVDGYVPPAAPVFVLPGAAGRAALVDGLRERGEATAHDLVVADALAGVLTGGDVDGPVTLDEAGVLALERAAFLRLVGTAPTLARIEYFLETGKALRN